MDNIVTIKNVSIDYPLRKYSLRAVTNLSMDIKRGKITALVGESGSGKTTLSSSLIRCISEPGVVSEGKIIFHEQTEDGVRDICVNDLSSKEINEFRWTKISMVFQAAQSALNPVMTIRQQLYETMVEHGSKLTKKEMEERCIELLGYVQLNPDLVLDAYPHELSGGMKQRVMIAFALLLDPQLVILDEPTTALDVITQSYIFNLLKKINEEKKISMLLMTHDISVVARFADYIGVMYGGRLMEYGSVEEVFEKRRHPYTEGLIGATPSIIGDISNMHPIEGSPPNLLNMPTGCVFHPRCQYCNELCKTEEPAAYVTESGCSSKCHLRRE